MSFDPIILYLHIPKAGGTTLNDCIYNQCCADEYYMAEEGYLHAGIYYYPIGFFKESHPSMPGNIKRALCRKDLRAVIGHFSFGIHRYLTRAWAYVTLLRNPLDRILSLYYHLNMLGSMTIEEFVANPPWREIDNDQTRRISGFDPEIGRCTKSTLNQAKENLRQYFSVVGVTERFDETLILLKRTFGWSKELLYYPKNVNPHRSTISSLPQNTLEAIMERNKFDIELYEFAKKLLDEAITAQDLSFQDEVNKFQSLKQSWYDSIASRKSQEDHN